LESTELVREKPERPTDVPPIRQDRVVYTYKDKKIEKTTL
jgi:hypothetical protein